MALKLMHRGEIHVDLSQVYNKQQQQSENNVLCTFSRWENDRATLLWWERQKDCVETDPKFELDFHCTKICKARPRDIYTEKESQIIC